jgi:tRNA1(Val) A37 N6-methylase TrmN6
LQPATGYRVAIDPVLLAAAVTPRPGERVLDAGSGTGAASLCLAVRCTGCEITGLEREATLVRMARSSAALNGLADRVRFEEGDLVDPCSPARMGTFDQVMTNPPYLSGQSATPPPLDARARAHVEGDAGLATWLLACLDLLRPKGTLTVIQRADRLDEVLAELRGLAGDIVIHPLWPTGQRDAKRVLVRGRKATRGPLRLARGTVLHYVDGGWTEEAEAILRGGEGLDLEGGRAG